MPKRITNIVLYPKGVLLRFARLTAQADKNGMNTLQPSPPSMTKTPPAFLFCRYPPTTVLQIALDRRKSFVIGNGRPAPPGLGLVPAVLKRPILSPARPFASLLQGNEGFGVVRDDPRRGAPPSDAGRGWSAR